MKKVFTQLDILSIALGAVIGWGCFVLPGTKFLPTAGPLGSVVGLTIGVVLVIIISTSYGYLLQKYPESGGEFIYVSQTFGKRHGFIAAWSLVLAYTMIIPLNGTAIGLLFRFLMPGVIEVGKLYTVAGWDVYAGELAVGLLFITLLAIFNYRGAKAAGWIQTITTLIMVGSVIVLTCMVLCSGNISFENLKPPFSTADGSKWYMGVFSVAAVAPWAFMGFDCIPQMTEEYNFSHKNSQKIMVCAEISALLMYVAVNTITALAIPWQNLVAQNSYWPTGYAIELITGKVGLTIVGIAMFSAILSTMNAFFLSGSRLIYSMSQNGVLPKCFSKLHKEHQTPFVPVIFIWAISMISPWFGREALGWIIDMTSVGTAIVFAYCTAAAAKLSYKEKQTKQFIYSVIGVVASVAFLALLLIPAMPSFLSIQSIVCLIVWLLLGVCFWMTIKRKYLGKDNQQGL